MVRISFSNMFKEFKSTATWLQFPFLCGAAKDSVYESTAKLARHGKIHLCRYKPLFVCICFDTLLYFCIIILHVLLQYWQYLCLCGPGLVGPAPTSVRWTCLMLDLQYILSVYLNRCYSQLKSVKLCANIAVKNMFTSDLLLDPGETYSRYVLYTYTLFLYM